MVLPWLDGRGDAVKQITYLALGLALGVYAMTLSAATSELQQCRTSQAHAVQVPVKLLQSMGGL